MASCRGEHAEPGDVFVAGQAAFRDRQYVWQLGRAHEARDAERAHRAAPHLAERTRHDGDGEVDEAGDHVGERRTGALVPYVIDLNRVPERELNRVTARCDELP